MAFQRISSPLFSILPRPQSAFATRAWDQPGAAHQPGVLQAMPESRPERIELAEGCHHSFADVPVHAPGSASLPDRLKTGIEHLAGLPMDDVVVHRNSSVPQRLQALAFAKGTDIHLASGQEHHLPHEAWHVVQQKQGRVRAPEISQQDGTSINDDPGLEREADQMGARALHGTIAEGSRKPSLSPAPLSAATAVTQCKKKVPTGFGDFETTEFDTATDPDGRKGVNITLQFNPDESKVDAMKIALVQAIKTTTPGGADIALGPTQAARMVPSGKAGAGYAIDQVETTNNPIYYNTKNLGTTEELKDTPLLPQSSSPDKVLTKANYELGYCYKEKPSDKDKKKHSAMLYDKPRSGKKKGNSQTFETAALAIDGADKGKYYGSVKWGFKMEGTDAAPTVSESDIDLASTKGRPSDNFIEPAKLWNLGKTQGTLQVKTSPDVTVKKVGTADTVTLKQGTKLKQVAGLLFGGETPAIRAEVLKDDGTSTGITVDIKTSDVEDLGGSPNKKLPV